MLRRLYPGLRYAPSWAIMHAPEALWCSGDSNPGLRYAPSWAIMHAPAALWGSGDSKPSPKIIGGSGLKLELRNQLLQLGRHVLQRLG